MVRPISRHAEDLLVERCRQGQRAAQDEFYRTYRPMVMRTLHRMLRSHRDIVEDVVQEVFIAAFASLPRFRGDAKVSTWLHRMSVHVALRVVGKQARQVQIADGSDFELNERRTPQRSAETAEHLRAVHSILQTLSPRRRAVFELCQIQEHAPREIASILGTTVITIRVRLHYARKEFFERARRDPAVRALATHAEMP